MKTRIVLTLDRDVSTGIEEAVRRSGRPFEQVVNDLLRKGLQRLGTAAPFNVEATDLGLRRGIEIDRIGNLLERIEGPVHR